MAGRSAGGFRYVDDERLALLGANEAPVPPPRSVLDGVTRQLGRLHRYPDPDSARLRAALAASLAVPPRRIAIGNGAGALLYDLARATLDSTRTLVYPWPSYYTFPKLAEITGARPIAVPLDDADRVDLEQLAAACDGRTGLLCICDPNNPTGTTVELDRIAASLAGLPRDLCVVIDEAYCEFASPQRRAESIELLWEFPRIVLVRTFSKAHRLAGARVGYALCGEATTAKAIEVQGYGFAVNSLAQAAALEALARPEELAGHVARTVEIRASLTGQLRELGLGPAESHANFVWTRLPDAIRDSDVAASLLDRGVAVATGSELGGVNALRITCGAESEIDALVSCLRDVLPTVERTP